MIKENGRVAKSDLKGLDCDWDGKATVRSQELTGKEPAIDVEIEIKMYRDSEYVGTIKKTETLYHDDFIWSDIA